MKLEDIAIVLSARPFKDTQLLFRCFFRSYGIISGVAKKNYRQKSSALSIPGTLIQASWYARMPEHLGTFNSIESYDFGASSLLLLNQRKGLFLSSIIKG